MKGLNFWRQWPTIAVFVVLAICAVVRADAQLAVTTATLSGTITDASHAIVPGARVTLTSTDKGISRSFVTNDTGQYLFTQLPPSNYLLSVEAKDFEKYLQKGLSLDAGASYRQDVALKVGSITEQVVVTDAPPLMNLDDANVSTDISTRQINELPLNLRNIFGLVTLNSSVGNTQEMQSLMGGGSNVSDNADQDVSFFHFGGGFFGTSAFLLDQAWDTDTNWGGVIYVPSVDAVEEFKIQNNSFTAQYGWSTGNAVSVVTKSGGNAFHGDIYEFFRDSALDANLYFNDLNGIPKPTFHRNQVGVSAGGPLWLTHHASKKTFIFGLYEHFEVGTLASGTYTVPDNNQLSSNFTDYSEFLGQAEGTDNLGRPILSGAIYDPKSVRTITQGETDPVTGLTALASGWIRDAIPGNNLNNLSYYTPDPVALKILSYFPKPTNSSIQGNNFIASGVAPAQSNEYLMRVDHNFTDHTHLFGRYSYKSESKTYVPNFWDVGGKADPAGPGSWAPNNRWNVAAGFNHAFNQSFLLSVGFGIVHWVQGSVVQSTGFSPSSLGLPTYLDSSPEFPAIQIGNLSGTAGGSGSGANSSVSNGPIETLNVDFTKAKGKHTINFGFMGVELKNSIKQNYFNVLGVGTTFTQGPDPQNPSANTGNGIAQALLSLPDGGQTGVAYNGSTQRHFLGWYVQDDWHVSPKLTMNLGFRYEIQGAPTVGGNKADIFNPNAVNPISLAVGQTFRGAVQFPTSGNRGVYETNYKNFAPRIGLSYAISQALALRAGYGIFYPQAMGSITSGATAVDGYSPTTPVSPSVQGLGIQPVSGLSLSNPWPGGYIPVTGNTLGGLQDVGYSVSSTNTVSRKSPYVQQYMLGLQYAFTRKDSLEADYVGNHGVHTIIAGLNADQLNPQYLSMGVGALTSSVTNPFYGLINFNGGASSCGLDQSTIPAVQMLTPYPQYCGVGNQNPTAGWSNYNSLQTKYTHHFDGGLNVLVSYTYSKFLDVNEGNQNWAYQGAPGGLANNYNIAGDKSVDGGDIPHTLVASYVYELPIGRGKKIGSGLNRAADAVIGGWEISGVTSLHGGVPLGISGNLYPQNFGGNPRPDVVGDVHVAHRSIQEWFNTGAFNYAAYGTWGTAPRFFSNLRGPHYQNWDLAMMKNWKLFHEARVQFRAEMYNAFNHPNFNSPAQGYPGCDPNADSSCASTFGQISSSFPGREVQLAGKFYW